MNLPPMPDLTLTMAQQFEIAALMRDCEKTRQRTTSYNFIESCLQQMTMYKNTINKLIREWPNELSKYSPDHYKAGIDRTWDFIISQDLDFSRATSSSTSPEPD